MSGGEPVDEAVRVARLVSAHGGRALIVGGWVRDQVMGHPSKDIDIEIFGYEIAPEGPTEHAIAFAVAGLALFLIGYGAFAVVRDLRRWRQRA